MLPRFGGPTTVTEASMSSPRILAVGSAIALILAGAMAAAQTSGGVPTYSFEPVDPACQSRTMTATGGPFPKNPHTLMLRWASFANYELVYNGQVILLDAYFDRGYGYAATGPAGGFQPLGFKAADVKKVNAIFLGHGHYDHMSDAASIGARTGAMVVGGPPSAEKLYAQPIDRKQVKSVTGRGGEALNFKGFTVEPILGRHSDNPAKITKTLEDALKSVSVSKQMTPAEAAEQKEVL